MFAEQMYAEDMFYKEHSEEEYALWKMLKN
jgi:hypothetical protein